MIYSQTDPITSIQTPNRDMDEWNLCFRIPPAIFNVIETKSYYVVSLDLPSLPDRSGELQLKPGITVVYNEEDRPVQNEPSLLFYSQLDPKRSRSCFSSGVLRLFLSKEDNSNHSNQRMM